MVGTVVRFLTRTRGRGRLHWTDWLSYGYLLLGIVLMFGPVIWVALSSFKTQAQLLEFPPTFLPYAQITAEVEGYQKPLPLYRVQTEDGERILAQVRRVGIQSQLVDPEHPQDKIRVNINQLQPLREFKLAWGNYSDLFELFDFGRYLWNSVFITSVATLIMLVINSMAAFALAKYDFRGRTSVFVLIIATLMIPPTIVLVPTFLVVSQMGLLNNPWGVIWPGAATPTGVFLLRQYMLTIPDDFTRCRAYG